MSICSSTYCWSVVCRHGRRTPANVLTKAPKIHLRDSGLLHALLGIRDLNELLGHPAVGGSYESFVVETIIGAAGHDGTIVRGASAKPEGDCSRGSTRRDGTIGPRTTGDALQDCAAKQQRGGAEPEDVE